MATAIIVCRGSYDCLSVLSTLYMFHNQYLCSCSWLYRIRPSVVHEPFEELEVEHFTNNWNEYPPNPNQVRRYDYH